MRVEPRVVWPASCTEGIRGVFLFYKVTNADVKLAVEAMPITDSVYKVGNPHKRVALRYRLIAKLG